MGMRIDKVTFYISPASCSLQQ